MRVPTLLVATCALSSCQLIIGIDETYEEPDAATDVELSITALGMVAPVTVQVTIAGVPTSAEVTADGLTALPRAPLGATYALSLTGDSGCLLGPNAAGTLASPITIELTCPGVTRLADLRLAAATATPWTFDGAQLSYALDLPELTTGFTSTLTAETAFGAAQLTIDEVAVTSGTAVTLDLASLETNVVVKVEWPNAPALTTTYALTLTRALDVAPAFATHPANFASFGWAIAHDDTRLIVGAPNEDGLGDPAIEDTAPLSTGVAYVYTRVDGAWQLEDYLRAPNAGALDLFGSDVAISGSWAIVSALGEASADPANPDDDSLPSAGAAYLYERVGADWVFRQYLKAPAAANLENGYFGHAVALDGDTAVVGAIRHVGNGGAHVGGGQVYVYRRSGGTWTLEANLEPDAVTGPGDNLGYDVALDGDRLAASAVNGNPLVSAAGQVRIYQRTGTDWALDDGGAVTAPATAARTYDFFGTAVALDGDRLLVGASEPLSAGGAAVSTTSGAAYIFTRQANGWTAPPVELRPANADIDDEFGRSVAVRGDMIAIGAFREDGGDGGTTHAPDTANDTADAGAVYLYRADGAAWSLARYVKAATPLADAWFGVALALTPTGLLVGAPTDDTVAPNAGAVHVYP